MTRIVIALLVLGMHGAVTAQTPEECMVKSGQKTAATATYNGKTYAFRRTECRDVFLSDPERYAQLYDALAQLEAEGTPLEAPRDSSLVPS